MSRTSSERIADILEAIAKCQRYAGSLDGDDPTLVDMAQDAIERNLQVIGEAANALPTDVTGAHPEIPWPQIRGFRNILVHEYFGVDVATIREVIDAHLPQLSAALEEQIAE
ncbi:DUF86 domain-containing protein [Gryllotalpicola daejeonensis]|uniref:DUF86 domain-containing protein n=1 Tax=Gryllotalpicola daejeonensis TaxID=993087 RepID=A0ABP7ZKL8_9MICO